MEAKPNQPAAVGPLTSHLKNHPNKTKTCRALLEKLVWPRKQHSLMYFYTWMQQFWRISMDLHMCRHWMLSRGPVKRDRWWGRMVCKNQGTPYNQHNLKIIKSVGQASRIRWLVDWDLWNINLCWLFHAKSSCNIPIINGCVK